VYIFFKCDFPFHPFTLRGQNVNAQRSTRKPVKSKTGQNETDFVPLKKQEKKTRTEVGRNFKKALNLASDCFLKRGWQRWQSHLKR